MPIELLDTTTAHDGWCRLLVVKVRLGSGETLRREIEDHGRTACVLPYDPLRKTAILVRQFRAPVFLAAGREETLEAVAGIIESESATECARREAIEEAGLRLANLEPVVTGWTMPGLSTERMDFFLAPYGPADRVAAVHTAADAEEPIDAVEMSLAQLAEMADGGELTDIKALLLVQTLRLRRPDLF